MRGTGWLIAREEVRLRRQQLQQRPQERPVAHRDGKMNRPWPMHDATPATAVVGSNLYAITGFNGAPDYTAVNEHFNGASWTTQAPIPVPHAQSRGTAVGTNIYVPGGFNSVVVRRPARYDADL